MHYMYFEQYDIASSMGTAMIHDTAGRSAAGRRFTQATIVVVEQVKSFSPAIFPAMIIILQAKTIMKLSIICLLLCSANAFVAGGTVIPTHGHPHPPPIQPSSSSSVLHSTASTGSEPSQPGQVVRQLKRPNEIRGSNRYGSENNSTILSPEEAAAAVGVKPANPKATKKTWQRAWRLHKRMLPILHAFDRNKPPDSSLSLAVLWWKALSGNDESSPAYDGGLSYDLLPRGTRAIVSKRLRRFYPRLHHANVEIRTAYLDSAIANVVNEVRKEDTCTPKRIRLIMLGGGYDIRSLKLRQRGLINEAVELDLPNVVEAKKKLFHNRLLRRRRRRGMIDQDLPKMMPIDLNQLDEVREKLEGIVTSSVNNSDSKQYHNIFVFEGVMIYLDDGVPSALLGICSDVLNNHGLDGSLCFADRLEHVPEGNLDDGIVELNNNGWELVDWLPKPGLARHQGSARLLSASME